MAISLMSSGLVYGQMVVDAVMSIGDSTDFVVLDDFQNFSQIDNSGNMVLDGDGVNENSGVINNTGSFGVGSDWTNLGTARASGSVRHQRRGFYGAGARRRCAASHLLAIAAQNAVRTWLERVGA